MSSETIQISTDDGVAEAYVSRPDDGDHPAVLFYIDAIGLRRASRRWLTASRLGATS